MFQNDVEVVENLEVIQLCRMFVEFHENNDLFGDSFGL